MYFAEKYSHAKLELYLSFLWDIVEKKNENYKPIFINIFNEVHDLSTGKINYSKVSSETFDIVSVLAFNHADYFKSIDTNALGVEDYRKILSYLQEDIKQIA